MKRFLSVFLLSLFAAVVMAGTEVYTPTLKAPANNAVNQMPNVIVSWNAIVGSINLQYEVQLDTTINFNSPKLSDTTITLLAGYTTHELLFGAKYYWRVRAIDLGQTSMWSVIRTFTVFSQVTLTSPKNNAAQDTVGPTQQLIWSNLVGGKAITGIKYFDIQLDTSQNFNSTQLHSGTVASTVYFFEVKNLRFGAKYYWRVRARHNMSTGQWSTTWGFTVTNAITLTTPANNAIDQMLDAKLNWKAVKGLLGYEYELALDAAFTNVISSSEVAVNYAYSLFTKFGTKYYWRVRGRIISDTMAWSNVNAFTTIDKVKLSTPSNNATNIAVKPTLKWTKQTGVVKYQLQVDLSPDFTTLFLDLKFADSITQYVVTKKMTNSAKYYWRMRAFADSQIPDTSGWSEVWNFTIAAPIGIGETVLSASSIYPNPASGKVTVKLEVEEPVSLQLAVIDLLGSSLIREEYNLTTGTNIKEIDLSNLSKGVYIVRLMYNGTLINHKLIVDK